MDFNKMKDRVRVGKQAKEDAKIMHDLLSGSDLEIIEANRERYCESFCEALKKLFGVPASSSAKPKPEAIPFARLGQQSLTYGKYKGVPFEDVPLDYLDWMLDRQEESIKMLRLYIQHPEHARR